MERIRIKHGTYTKLYEFDGGAYYTPDSGVGAWVAVMDDDSVQLLFNGRHVPTDYDYEAIGENDL